VLLLACVLVCVSVNVLVLGLACVLVCVSGCVTVSVSVC